MIKSLEHEIYVKGIELYCVIKEYVEDNNFARFTLTAITAFEKYTLMLNARLDMNSARSA